MNKNIRNKIKELKETFELFLYTVESRQTIKAIKIKSENQFNFFAKWLLFKNLISTKPNNISQTTEKYPYLHTVLHMVINDMNVSIFKFANKYTAKIETKDFRRCSFYDNRAKKLYEHAQSALQR